MEHIQQNSTKIVDTLNNALMKEYQVGAGEKIVYAIPGVVGLGDNKDLQRRVRKIQRLQSHEYSQDFQAHRVSFVSSRVQRSVRVRTKRAPRRWADLDVRRMLDRLQRVTHRPQSPIGGTESL